MRKQVSFLCAVVGLLLGWQLGLAQATGPVYTVTLDAGLTAPAAGVLRRALQQATAANAQALVVKLSDGGAVLAVARPLAREIAAAKLPVVVWVAPRGTSGGAAGALLLAASQVAVMAPGSTAGFAAPLVTATGAFSPQTQQRVVDDVATELRGWQLEHGRNAEWIDRAARTGAITTAEAAQAAEPPIIDLVAADEPELLTTLDGRTVRLADGTTRQLHTLGVQPIAITPTTWEAVSQRLAQPTVAFVCFVLGALALALELSAPGTSIPGVAGVVLLTAAFYGFLQGHVRPAAVLVLAAGLVLLCAEPLVMAHGGLALAGLVCLVLGALWLTDPVESMGLNIAPLTLVGVVLLLALGIGALVLLAVRVRRQRPATGMAAMIGQVAEVRERIDPNGMIFVQGALWRAWSDQGPFEAGDFVEISAVADLRVYVVPLSQPMAAAAA